MDTNAVERLVSARAMDEAGSRPVAASRRAAVQGDPLPEQPVLPAEPSDPDPGALAAVRDFHHGIGEARRRLAIDAPLTPVQLWRLRDPAAVRTAFPLVLYGPANDGGGEQEPFAPLAEALDGAVPRDAGLLRDNLVRLERLVRDEVGFSATIRDGHEVLRKAARRLERQLALRGDSGQRLHEQLEQLVDALPDGARLLPYHADADLALLRHIAGSEIGRARQRFAERLCGLRAQIQSRLDVERHKTPAGRAGSSLASQIGAAGRFFDSGGLAQVIGERHRGTEVMDPERRARFEAIVGAIDEYLQQQQPLLCVVSERPLSPELTSGAGCESCRVDDAVAGAAHRFDEVAEHYVAIARAVEVAELELTGARGLYDPQRHDAWFGSYSWRRFSEELLQLLPAVVAVSSDARLEGAQLAALSSLLLSSRPVQVLVRAQPARGAPAASGGGEPGGASGLRFEPSYLGISHREALVWQGTATQPRQLLEGLRRALRSRRAALFVVACGQTLDRRVSSIGPQMHVAAAIEGRAHPLFGYDPEAGFGWARRFDFAGNPAIETDWPAEQVAYREGRRDGPPAELSLPFTFADFALLDPAWRGCFGRVPPGCTTSEALLPIADYLALEQREAATRVPFVWAVDSEGTLARLAVAGELVEACRDRLAFWRTLQELAGVRSEYVERGVAQARAEAEAAAAQRIAELERDHAAEIERVRRDAASETLGRLASALVSGEGAMLSFESALPAGGAPAAGQPAAAASGEGAPAAEPSGGGAPAEREAAGQEQQPAVEQEDDEELSFDEPWIDSALCTSCNDCLDINPQLFVYDDNKQARIGDPKAGTFEQLVSAAEKCAAKCIHPGKPQNPGEDNLEELLRRAAALG